jgi:3-deoxy-D-manno-octulosonate 8-phosphate phosphatase (KDO 8-P phosphatase)
MITDELRSRIARIKMVVMDVDGVLTDGRIILGNYGDELKFFDVQDGLGMVMMRRAGLKTIIVTSKKSRINQKRAKEVQVVKIFQKVSDKLKVVEKVARKHQISMDEVCFIGDDLIDLPVIRRAGFSVAVRNAVEDVKKHANLITENNGGRGAVRELADLILKTQGKWTEVTQRYFA